jgi:hypothetical protein
MVECDRAKKETGVEEQQKGGESESRADTEVAHHATDVAGVKYPANAICESITWIDDAGDLFKNEMAGFLPILDSKVLYVDMAGTLSGTIGVDHFNCRLRELFVVKFALEDSTILKDDSGCTTLEVRCFLVKCLVIMS